MADKANGAQPVAWLKRNGRVFVDSAHTVRTHAERSAENDKGAEVVPLVLASDYEHLEAKLEAAERDAARYRWLRENANGTAWNEHDYALVGLTIPKRPGTCAFDMTPEVIDAAIDAQRQEGK